MRQFRAFVVRILGIVRSSSAEQAFADELESHLQMHIDDNLRSGMTPEQARRDAILKLGGVEQTKQAYREQSVVLFLENLLQDARYAMRQLRRSPGFACTAVITLALGLGVNTAVFSAMKAILLTALPVTQPEQLYRPVLSSGSSPMLLSYADLTQWREGLRTKATVLAFSHLSSMQVRLSREVPQSNRGQLVSADFFSGLGVSPALGRLEWSHRDRTSDEAILSFSFWKERLHQSANVVGSQVVVNGASFTVIGVAPFGFFGVLPGSRPDVWLPLAAQSSVHYREYFGYSKMAVEDTWKPWMNQPGVSWLETMFRIPDKHGTAVVAAYLNQLAQPELRAEAVESPDLATRNAILHTRVVLEPSARGLPELRNQYAKPLAVLMSMTVLLLLAACANIAHLLLVRAKSREREIAIRMCLGASRGRLIQQQMMESCLLGLCGGCAGLLLSFAGVRILLLLLSQTAPGVRIVAPVSTTMLAFNGIASLLAVIAFGLLPALYSTGSGAAGAPRVVAPSVGVLRRDALWGRALAGLQIALSLVLLVAAGLLGRTLHALLSVNTGFDQEHVISAVIDPMGSGYRADELAALYQRVVERVDALPGVRSSAIDMCALSSGCESPSGMAAGGGTQIAGQHDVVGEHYFAAMGIPVLAGRDFAEADRQKGARSAILNATAARQLFPKGNAIGAFVRRYSFGDPPNGLELIVVGVVADSKVRADSHQGVPPMMYATLAQGSAFATALNVRVAGQPGAFMPVLRRALFQAAPRLAVRDTLTLKEVVHQGVATEDVLAQLLFVFGGLALALAAVGIYGTISYLSVMRVQEFGVRLALGESRRAVAASVLWRTARMIAFGVGMGLPLALICAHLMRGIVFGIGAIDPFTFAGSIAVLSFVGLMASLKPAWRAASTDPMSALRND